MKRGALPSSGPPVGAGNDAKWNEDSGGAFACVTPVGLLPPSVTRAAEKTGIPIAARKGKVIDVEHRLKESGFALNPDKVANASS